MQADIEHYRHRVVRDLAWAIATPPLIEPGGHHCEWPSAAWYAQQYRLAQDWVHGLDQDPGELQALLAGQKDRRLGRYFETLWYHWLMHHPDYQLLAHNLQVIIDGETLGELDFIVRDRRSDEVIHIEVAVKFYLGIGDTRQMRNWHGPGLKDRLDKKVAHLKGRQTCIGQDERIRQWLQRQGLVIDRCAVILKGRLYYPAHQFPDIDDLSLLADYAPAESSRQHLRSWWYRKSEFALKISERERFYPLINQGWLQRIPTNELDKKLSKKELFQSESSGLFRLPLHLQRCNPHHSWSRAFLTDDQWGSKKTDIIADI